MAKKKELPKAMSGGIKPLIRAVVATGKVAGKATVRGGKAYHNAIEHAPAIKGPVSFVKAGKEGIKAAGKGFTRGVKSEIKAEKAKAAKKVATGNTGRTRTDWMNAGTPKPAPTPKPTSGKKIMTPEQKKKLKKVAIVGGAGAAIGTYKYANRKRRTLND